MAPSRPAASRDEIKEKKKKRTRLIQYDRKGVFHRQKCG